MTRNSSSEPHRAARDNPDLPFTGDPAYQTLDGAASIAYRRAGSTIVDVLVIAWIPLVAILGLLTAPRAGEPSAIGMPVAIERTDTTGSIASPPPTAHEASFVRTSACNRPRNPTT